MDLSGLDLVPLDRIAGVIDFHPFSGLELAGGDRRLAVLRELAVELFPEVRVRDERFRSLLPDKFHRVAEAELVDDPAAVRTAPSTKDPGSPPSGASGARRRGFGAPGAASNLRRWRSLASSVQRPGGA